jgi:hypothetical protein
VPIDIVNETELARKLKTMDLPWNRKKEFTPQKLRWLKKNLGKRNAEHKNFEEALELIDIMLE